MVLVGDKPIIWHIMKHFSAFGVNDFIICAGYLGDVIKEYFANYSYHNSDVTFDVSGKSAPIYHNNPNESWKVTVVDTGKTADTAGRLLQVKRYLDSKEPFFFTYGDGVSNVNLNNLYAHHLESKKIVTMTTVQTPGRYGSIEVSSDSTVLRFVEKPHGDSGWINGGFFVVNPEALNYIYSTNDCWETNTLPRLVSENEVTSFKHTGFWQAMDTLRDNRRLTSLWNSGDAPWKTW